MDQNVIDLTNTVTTLVNDFAPIPGEVSAILSNVKPTDPAQAQAITDATTKLQALDTAIKQVQASLAPTGGTPTP